MHNGKLATIIFIRDRNARGHEVCVCACMHGAGAGSCAVAAATTSPSPSASLPHHCPGVHSFPAQVSGYIDYAHRLKSDGGMVFEGTKRLMPRPSDLSFYNWETHLSTSNPTPNFQVRRVVGCVVRPRPVRRPRQPD